MILSATTSSFVRCPTVNMRALKSSQQFIRASQRSFSGRRRLGRVILRAQWGADVVFSDAVILESGKAADNLQRLIVDIGSLSSGYNHPGQFIQAKTVSDGKAGFFAIASPPDTNNPGIIELLIKPQGEAAEAICSAKEGSTVMVSPVMGKGFPISQLPSSAFNRLYLFATGSGISPIKALIESGALESGSRQDVKLFYGTRNPAAMAYADRLKLWEQDYGVEVVPVYSQQGQGYVQDVFIKNGYGAQGGQGMGAVLCGQKAMAEAITEALTNAGVAKQHILTNF